MDAKGLGKQNANKMTKRQAFAMAAMQGLRASSEYAYNGECCWDSREVAKQALRDADALLAALLKGT